MIARNPAAIDRQLRAHWRRYDESNGPSRGYFEPLTPEHPCSRIIKLSLYARSQSIDFRCLPEVSCRSSSSGLYGVAGLANAHVAAGFFRVNPTACCLLPYQLPMVWRVEAVTR